jgi:isopenicillin N synthase-like dioxygenase
MDQGPAGVRLGQRRTDHGLRVAAPDTVGDVAAVPTRRDGAAPVGIPVIDIAPASDRDGRAAVVAAIRQACTNVGVLQITGHGVPLDLLDAVYDSVDRLARLTPDEKAALLSPTGHRFRGLVDGRDEDGRVLVESLQVNVYDTPADAVAAGVDERYRSYFHPNVWPDIPGLRAAWLACAAATRRLGLTLMGLFAETLDLPASYFAPCFDLDVTQFGINWYPPQPPVDDPRARVLTRAHADSGVLTILHQRGGYEGLQVLSRDGTWVDVPVLGEAFVINIGHLMHRWTNATWPATMHRVVASGDPAAFRTSIVTFFLPAVDTVIAPLPTMVGFEGPRFPAVMQYNWESEYLESEGLTPGGRCPEAVAGAAAASAANVG